MLSRFRFLVLMFSLFVTSPTVDAAIRRDVPVEKWLKQTNEAKEIFSRACKKTGGTLEEFLPMYMQLKQEIRFDVEGRCEIPKLKFLSLNSSLYADLRRHALYLLIFEGPRSKHVAAYIRRHLEKMNNAFKEVKEFKRDLQSRDPDKFETTFTKERLDILGALQIYCMVLSSMTDDDLCKLVEMEKNRQWWKSVWRNTGKLAVAGAVAGTLFYLYGEYVGEKVLNPDVVAFDHELLKAKLETKQLTSQKARAFNSAISEIIVKNKLKKFYEVTNISEEQVEAIRNAYDKNGLVNLRVQPYHLRLKANEAQIKNLLDLRNSALRSPKGRFLNGLPAYTKETIKFAHTLAKIDSSNHKAKRGLAGKLLPQVVGITGAIVGSPIMPIENSRVKEFVASSGLPMLVGLIDYLRSDGCKASLATLNEENCGASEKILTMLRMIFGALYYNTWSLAPYAARIGVEKAYKISNLRADGIRHPLVWMWKNYIDGLGLPAWTNVIFNQVKNTPEFIAFLIDLLIPVAISLKNWHTFPELGRYLSENFRRYCVKLSMSNFYLKWGTLYSPYAYAKFFVDMGSEAGILPMDVTGEYLEAEKVEYLQDAKEIITHRHGDELYSFDYLAYHLASEWEPSYTIFQCSWKVDVFEKGFSLGILQSLFTKNFLCKDPKKSYGFAKPETLEDVVEIMNENGFTGRSATLNGWQ